MSVLPGHEDLRPKQVANLTLFAEDGNDLRRYRVCIRPDGSLLAVPEAETIVDQLNSPQKTPLSQRWNGTDQGLDRGTHGSK